MLKSKEKNFKDKGFIFAISFFIILSLSWLTLQLLPSTDLNEQRKVIWASLYQVVAIFGGVCGFFISRSWGGFRSVMGRSVMAFSLGLILQAFGQSVYSTYNLLLHVEIPYPSIGDIGFFGSIPLYIYGILLLSKASGVKVSLQSFSNKVQGILIPLVILLASYLFFLREYEFDFSNPLIIILDFGYPLGQAIYISIAILTYVLSKKILGGLMRPKILFILIALFVQYIADYNFLYQAHQGTWSNGGYGDFIYLITYLFMTIGILQLNLRYLKPGK